MTDPAGNGRQDHARFRDDWLRRLAGERNLSASDLATGVALVLHLSRTRVAWPSIDRIAAQTNRDASTVWRSINRLEGAGLIKVMRGRGRRNSNHYQFLEKTAPPQSFENTAPPQTFNSEKHCEPARKNTANSQIELLNEPLKISRGALRSPKISGARELYAWSGRIIRLRPADLEKWRQAYRDIPDLEAALQRADDYYAEHPPEDGKWYFRVSRWLAKDNEDYAEKRKAAERERDSW